MSTLLKTVCVCACLFAAAGTRIVAQEEARAAEAANDSDDLKRGIALYRRGDAKSALPVLRQAVKGGKDGARAWHFLGLALSRTREFKEAAEAFARAVNLDPNYAHAHAGLAYTQFALNKYEDAERAAGRALALDKRSAEAHYVFGAVQLRKLGAAQALESAEAALKINPNFAPAWLLKAQSLIGLHNADFAPLFDLLTKQKPKPEPRTREERAELARPLREAALAFEQYIKLNRNPSLLPELREQLETLRAHAMGLAPDGEPLIYMPDEVTTKAVLLTKPKPVIPRDILTRQTWNIGSVALRMVLAADGQVRHIFVISGLPDGLTEEVIKAVREIKFTPATKDGRPVSQFLTFQYTFNL
jgi:tetratricopeptide (TPR) repeat protein